MGHDRFDRYHAPEFHINGQTKRYNMWKQLSTLTFNRSKKIQRDRTNEAAANRK